MPPYRLAVVAPHVVQYHAPLYRQLARRDELDVHVLYLDRTGARPTYDATMDATIDWDVPLLEGYGHEFVRNLAPSPAGGGFSSRVNPGLVPRLLQARWDAVLIQGYAQLSWWLALPCARLRRARVLYRGEATLRDPRRGLREGLKRAVLKTLFRLCDVVFYSCRGNRRFLRHYGCPSERMALLPCAVDNAFFRSRRAALAGEEAATRAGLEIPTGMPIVLNVGRHDGYKSQPDLIRAIDLLRRQGIEAALVLVGSGPETPALERQAADLGLRYVRFTGFVNQSEVPRYYAAADVFALASAYDPSPKVLNEALNFELPIVCSDRAGTAGDVAVDGDNGFLYPWGDARTLARALGRLLADPGLRRRMGRRSLEPADIWTLEAGADAVVEALRARIGAGGEHGRP